MGYNKESAKPSERLLAVLAPSGRAIGRVVVAGLVGVILAASPITASAEEAIQAAAASKEDAIVEVVEAQEEALDEVAATLTVEEQNADGQATDVQTSDEQAATEQTTLVQDVVEQDTDVQEEVGETADDLADVADQDDTLTGDAVDDADAQADADQEGVMPEGEDGELAELANESDPAAADPLTAQVESVTEPVTAAKQGKWVVDARTGKYERYWYWEDGTLAKNVLITPENGASYYAWALSDGRILRGKWDSGTGRVYVADNDGKLIGSDMDSNGWVVTSIYDGGKQRYYVDAILKAACSGFFTVDGYGDVFGRGGDGYVVRGDFTFGNRKWSANNDGQLRSGWYVTDGFGQGLQRYWMGDTVFGSPHAAAQARLILASKDKSGYDAYAMADGRILRGRWDTGNGRVYIADNGGKLIGSGMTSSGWVVTKKYDGSMQRYYVDAVTKAACSGFFTVDGYGDVFGQPATGIILRGALPFGTSVILADNDGKLPNATGWLITNIYGQGLQRYWIEKINGQYKGTKPGYSTAGYAHVTTAAGYVLRNGVQMVGNKAYEADNDGKVKEVAVGWTTINGKRYYRRLDGSLVQVTNAGYSAWKGVQSYSSGTGYIITIDNSACRVCVFTGTQGSWMPFSDWTATVGTTPENGGDETFGVTFRGVSHVRKKGYVMGQCPYEFYWTEFYINSAALNSDGEGQRFHSILYWDRGMSSVYDGTLGRQASHGCVRLATENAKWIYDNIPIGTTVWSY